MTKRLRRRTLDLIVIAWVVAVGLTTGRQLVDWWREDPATVPQSGRDVGEDWSRRPVDVLVGPRGVPLHRSPFVGSRPAVEQRLMQLVQARLKDANRPNAPADDAERQFVGQLNKELPIVPDHGEGTLYRWPAPWPGVVGTRRIDDLERILVHGFAVPSGENKWTIFVVTESAKSPSSASLPPGAVPLLSWTDDAGRQVSSFRGAGNLADWISFWDSRYQAGVCTVRDIRPGSATLQFRQNDFVIDVQMQLSENGQLTGVVWTMPLSPPDALQSLPTDPLATERSSKDSP